MFLDQCQVKFERSLSASIYKTFKNAGVWHTFQISWIRNCKEQIKYSCFKSSIGDPYVCQVNTHIFVLNTLNRENITKTKIISFFTLKIKSVQTDHWDKFKKKLKKTHIPHYCRMKKHYTYKPPPFCHHTAFPFLEYQPLWWVQNARSTDGTPCVLVAMCVHCYAPHCATQWNIAHAIQNFSQVKW